MAIDPNAPGRITVFKVNTDKIPYSQNTPEACAYCDKKRGHGEDALPLCSGCGSLRFCNREHQLAFWPQHKVFCKQQEKNRKANAIIEEMRQQYSPASSPFQDRLRLAEDWVEIHRHPLEEARAWALHIANPPLDFRSHYFKFHLKFRPDGEGNPSTSFHLVSAEVCKRGAGGPRDAMSLANYWPMTESAVAEERAAGTKGFLGVFPCLYVIDGAQVWTSASYIYDFELPTVRPEDRLWFWFPKYCADLGLVFRVIGPGHNDWKPGLMKKKGNKWVWKEHNLEKLAMQGVHITTVPRR
ncbi:hypothetical protein DFH09DRAFT_1284545 [Mycena vulgaris]|nr:hypothetical protein DFH09DRAFT_1284545 [Mycena vulgaris]